MEGKRYEPKALSAEVERLTRYTIDITLSLATNQKIVQNDSLCNHLI